MTRTPLLAALVLSLAGTAAAQSLGELAEQEKAKKKKDPSSVKSFSDKDLKKASPGPKASPPPTGDTRTEPASEDSAGSESIRGDEGYWRSGAEERRNTIKKIEQTVTELQARLDTLTLDVQPNPNDLFDPNRLQKREHEKGQLREGLDKAKADLVLARKALEDFEDEARRKGIPQGWLRD